MTTDEFMSLSVGGLQRLHKAVFGNLSLSRNKPALRKKLEGMDYSAIPLAVAVPPADPEDTDIKPPKDATPEAVAAPKKAAKRKAPAKKKPAKAKSTKKAQADNHEHAKAVSLIKSLHGAGKSLREITATLEKKGLRTARGSRKWWPSSIQSALGQRW